MTSQSSAVHLDVARRSGVSPGMLASDSDRDAAAGLLGEAFAAGRLTADEHAERLQAAYAARTWGDLAAQTSDLPGPSGATAASAAPRITHQIDPCLLCALLIACPPVGIAFLLAARRSGRATGSAHAENR
jgi:hypothetical protein